MNIQRATGIALVSLLLVSCSARSSAAGTWGTDEPGKPQLVLAEDGQVSGTDGCNRLTGSWELVENRVQLSPLASTMMMCEEVDTWLGAATTLEIDADLMFVFDSTGTELGSLDRQ